MRASASAALLCCMLFLAPGCSKTGGPAPECEGIVCSAGSCVVDGRGSPLCVCGAYEQAANLVCAIVEFDAPEADDQPDGATQLIPPVGPLLAEIGLRSGTAADVDHYVVAVDAGHTLRFLLLPEGDAPLPAVTVEPRNTPSVELPGPALHGQALWLEPTKDAALTFRVAPARLGATGPYRVQVDDYGIDVAPDAGLTSGSVFAGDLLPPGPLTDAYRVHSDAGEIVRVTCDGGVHLGVAPPDFEQPAMADTIEFEGSEWDPFRWLYVSATNAAWYSCEITTTGYDDFPDTPGGAHALDTPASGGVAFRTEFPNDRDHVTVPVSDAHCYQLSCAPACTVTPTEFEATSSRSPVLALAGEPGVHTVTVVDLGPDDHGDTYEDATVVSVGTVPGRRELSTDWDVFALDPEPGVYYAYTCVTATCSEQWSSPVTWYPLYLGMGTPAGGEYHFRGHDVPIRSFLSLGPHLLPSSYAITLRELGRDDHADTAARATPIGLGQAVTAVSELSGDLDHMAITLEPGTYEIVVDATTSGRHAFVVRDSAGVQVPLTAAQRTYPEPFVHRFSVTAAQVFTLTTNSDRYYGHGWVDRLVERFTVQRSP